MTKTIPTTTPCTLTPYGRVHSHGIGERCIRPERDDARRWQLQAWAEERMARAYARGDDARGDAWRDVANRLD